MENSDVGGQGNMAEAAVETPAARFFCHKCNLEINPVLPDYTCPSCQDGFIESLIQSVNESQEDAYNNAADNEDADALNQVADLWNMLSYIRRPDELPPNYLQSTPGGSSSQEARETRYMSRPGPSRRMRYTRYPPNRRTGQDPDPRSRTGDFLQQLVTTLSENTGLVTNAGFPVFLNLHSNPGDYAWGRGGWNAIISQLINQLDGTGPPPLSKEKITEIPTVNICQEQVAKNLQCTVCMEDFLLDEPVRRLTCDHHFHDSCIIPWLELHGTCPICRKLLNDGSVHDSVFSTAATLIDLTEPDETHSISDPHSDIPESDSRRNDSYNPHHPSVYDFSEEFD